MNRLIPIVSALPASALTEDNWRSAGIYQTAYALEDLLMKPQWPVLTAVDNLRTYCGAQDKLVLYVGFDFTKTETIRYRSIYDGQSMVVKLDALIELINHLNPDVLLWPNRPETRGGYTYCDGSYAAIKNRLETQPDFILTNQPAIDALAGIFYDQNGPNLLREKAFAADHFVMDEACGCCACAQKLTKAYFHHLFVETPLLANRFLIAHNYAHFQNANVMSSAARHDDVSAPRHDVNDRL